MSGFPYTMGLVGFCTYFILPALALSVNLEAVGHDVWPEVGGGLLAKSLLQSPCLVGSCLPVSFQIWNLMDIRSSFDMRLMNCESLK